MMRSRRASGASASILAAYAAALSLAPAIAKTPGEVHCYNDICHRVISLDEMQLLVGSLTEAVASYYDIPERDRFNTGGLTSSGEAFDAWSDSHAASSVYPDGTELLLWNPKNGLASHVRVNDFGPFYKRRTIDVTRGVAEKLDFSKTGVTSLKVFVVWAPDAVHARYSRQRVYPAVEGFLGRFDFDQLHPLKTRLMSQAVERNGQQPPGTMLAAASTPSAAAARRLPAYAGLPAQGGKEAVLATQILNTPRYQMSAIAPDAVIPAPTPITFAAHSSPTVLATAASPRAIAAASLPASAVAVQDHSVAIAVANIEAQQMPLNEPRPPYGTAIVEAGFLESARAWAPGPKGQMWQHLLLALGVLSAAAVSWRTRHALSLPGRSPAATTSGQPQRQSREAAPTPSAEGPGLWPEPSAGEPSVMQSTDGVMRPPLLPQRACARSDEDLRAEAAAQIERFDFAAAEITYRRLLAQREHAHGLDHPLTASAERHLADCLREQGRYAAAEPYYRRALAGMTLAAGDVHPAVADVLDGYAVSLLRQGRARDARGLARQALAIRRIAGTYNREFAVTLTIVAEANRAEGNLSEAETEHRDAWNRFIAISGAGSLDAAACMMSLGTVLSELGRFQAAEEFLNSGVRAVAEACGGDHPASASAYALLGDLYHRAGQLDAALGMHSYARAIRERVLGPRHPDTIESVLTIAVILTERLRMDEARMMIDTALEGLDACERLQMGPQNRVRRLLVSLGHSHGTSQTILPMVAA